MLQMRFGTKLCTNINLSLFTKMVGFSSLYQKGLSKIHILEKQRSLEIGEGIPLKKDRNRWERRALSGERSGSYNC